MTEALLLTAWLGCQAMDIHSTQSLLSQPGSAEGNPLLGQGAVRRNTIKLSVNGVMVFAYFKNRHRTPVKAGIAVGMAAAGCAGWWWNSQQGRP